MSGPDKECTRLFQQLLERIEKHEADTADKFDRLVETQQVNATTISDLAQSVSGVVQLHKDWQGAARVGKGVQGFMLWCLKWGAIGAGVVAIIKWTVERFQS